MSDKYLAAAVDFLLNEIAVLHECIYDLADGAEGQTFRWGESMERRRNFDKIIRSLKNVMSGKDE